MEVRALRTKYGIENKVRVMRNILINFLLAAVVAIPFTGCTNRDLEKRVAELESRLAESDGKKSVTPTQTTNANSPVPGITSQPAEQKPEGPLPVIQFEKTEHDFGRITEGRSVEYTYTFKNVGDAPLLIESARPSCGCTVPDWSKDPIPVGGTGFIKAKFDSKNAKGVQNKTITVTANTWPKQTVLRFRAEVAAASEAAGPVK